MLHKNPLYNINNWTDETVNKIYTMYIDEFNDIDRLYFCSKYITTEQKRNFLIESEKNFKLNLDIK